MKFKNTEQSDRDEIRTIFAHPAESPLPKQGQQQGAAVGSEDMGCLADLKQISKDKLEKPIASTQEEFISVEKQLAAKSKLNERTKANGSQLTSGAISENATAQSSLASMHAIEFMQALPRSSSSASASPSDNNASKVSSQEKTPSHSQEMKKLFRAVRIAKEKYEERNRNEA